MDNATLYAHSNGLQKRDALMVLREFLPKMDWSNEEETILDVGCGSGDVTKNLLLPLLPKNTRCLVGIDVSKEMVGYAAKNFSHNLVEFKELDIVNSINPRQHFPEGFTKITSFYCLHWIQDQERCLRNMFHLLREGGEVLLVFLASNPIFAMYEKLSESPKWKQYMNDVSNFIPVYQYKDEPEEVMKSCAENVGFDILFCDALSMTFPFQNANYLRNAISAVNPFLNRIPKEDRTEYLDTCIQDLTSRCSLDAFGVPIAEYKLMVTFLRKPFQCD